MRGQQHEQQHDSERQRERRARTSGRWGLDAIELALNRLCDRDEMILRLVEDAFIAGVIEGFDPDGGYVHHWTSTSSNSWVSVW